jgi:protein phosphatase
VNLRWGAITDVGRVRPHNEDQVLAEDDLFAVADGMGGHAGGEVAAQIAVETLKAGFRADPTADGLVHAMQQANTAVWERARDEPDLRGMGTTTTAAALVESDGEQLIEIAHVGDSRAYLLRDDELERLTDDHSLVEDLVRSGRLSPEDAANHPQRHIVTRALGHGDGDAGDIEVDTVMVAPFRGDRILLASDGLTNEVSDDQIASVLRRLGDPDDAARELVRLAKAAGGSDNISVVVIDVVDDNDKAGAASKALADQPAPDSTASVRISVPSTDRDPDRTRAKTTRAPMARPAFTMRTVAFVVAVAAVLGLAVLAITWYARGSYFVGARAGNVTIFRGRPGGFLWVKPTVYDRTDLKLDDVLPSRRDDVRDGQPEPTLRAARHYISNLRDEATAFAATTTTTTPPTSTTAAPAP